MKNSAVNGKYDRIAMVCQGGGSLGAYHIGALKAMEEAGYTPDMIAGISIGAFTAAIIAGNEPKDRISKLQEFWNLISWPEFTGYVSQNDTIHKSQNSLSSAQGFIFGQPNFFFPRMGIVQFQPQGTPAATSYYDTTPIRETLMKLVDFDGINKGTKSRLILGTSRVKDGKQIFFDSAITKIGSEHVMASGAMPPGFPGIRIDGDLYWDGGCISNTPLEGVFQALPQVHTLCFIIDLFAANGKEPQTMDEVSLKIKELQFSSRTDHHINQISDRHNVTVALKQMVGALPSAMHSNPMVMELEQQMGADVKFDIVHIAYNKPAWEVPTCDCEFSRSSIQARAEYGYHDMRQAIQQSPWLTQQQHAGTSVYKFVGGTLTASSKPFTLKTVLKPSVKGVAD